MTRLSAVDTALLSTTVRDLLREAQEILLKSGIENASQEASWLLQAGLGLSGLALHVDGGRVLTSSERERVIDLLQRRAGSEPLQYILGTQEFCGLEFLVTPAVLIPRPETELLVREAVSFVTRMPAPILTDIGTGSGCVAVALAKQIPQATIYAIDVSAAALTVAEANAKRHKVADRIRFLEGDCFLPLQEPGLDQRFSVVVSNPPYISDQDVSRLQPEVSNYEPRLALAGGPDGLAFHRRLLREAPAFLESGGLFVLEVGEGQAKAVAEEATRFSSYSDVHVLKDQAGLLRAVRLERSSILN